MTQPKTLITVLASFFLALSASAQQNNLNVPPNRTPELAVSYDLVGSNASTGQCGCFVLNGGSLTAAVPVHSSKFSIVGQFSGTHAGNIGSPKYDLTLLTYNFGVRYTPALRSRRVNLFVQGLIGGAHAGGSLVGSNTSATNAGAALAGSLGGGLDVRWKRLVSVRAFEASYQPTAFNNTTTGLQNNYRFSAGLVFHFPSR